MDTMYSDPNTGNPFSLNSTILWSLTSGDIEVVNASVARWL
jgi:hypothetical protein